MTAMRARVRGELLWGGVDQAASSATNFGLSVLAGRVLGSEGLGVIFLGFAMYLLALSAVRGLIMEPFVVATAALDEEAQEDATRACTILVAVVGAATSVLMAIVGLTLGDPLGRSLLIFAPWVGVAMLQDHWRSVLFRDERGRAAALNDGAWALGMVAMLPLALTFRHDWMIAATWGVGASVGAIVGGVQVKLRPSGPLHALTWWKREIRYLGTWLAIQNVVFSAGAQLTIVLLAEELGAADLGGIRAVDVVFSPMTLVGEAFAFPGVPIIARALAVSAAEARRWAGRLSIAALGLVGAYLTLVTPFSRPILSHLFGPEFTMFTAIVIPIALAQALRAASTGYAILLKADRRVHAITVCRGLKTGLALVLGPFLAARYGLVPAVWGTEIGVGVGSIAIIVCGLMSRDIRAGRRRPPDPGALPLSP
jgi:O-antigen/teichoic acid export membrane protein